ncbi:hypothetical protein ZONE111904_17295 [Zobellia nedashkovskayae]
MLLVYFRKKIKSLFVTKVTVETLIVKYLRTIINYKHKRNGTKSRI